MPKVCNRAGNLVLIRNKVPIQRSRLTPATDAALTGFVRGAGFTSMAPRRVSHDDSKRRRNVSVSFDPPQLKWVDTLVDTLEKAGYPAPARSDVIRIALGDLQEALKDKPPAEIAEYLAQRHADRFLAAVRGTR